MSGMRELLGSAAMVSGNNIATSAINFVTFLLLIGGLGTFGFGLYSLAVSVLAFCVLLLDLGLGKVIVSDVSKEMSEGKAENAAGLFGGFIAVQGILGAAIFALLVLFSDSISAHFSREITTLVQLIAVLVLTGAMKNIYITSFQVVADFRKFASFLFADAASKLAFIFVAISYLGPAVENVLLASIASEVLLLALFWTQIPAQIRAMKFPFAKAKELFLAMVKRHGKWTFAFSQARNIESNIPPWIVEFFLGVNAVGIYSALVKIQVLVIRLFEPLETIFFPFISRLGKFEESSRTVLRATKYIFYVSIPVVLGLIVFMEPVVFLVLGEKFVPHSNVLRVLLLTVFLFILNIPMKPFFYNLKAQKELTLISSAVLISTLVLGSTMTLYLGLIGIALNHIASPLIDLLLRAFYMKRLTGEKYGLAEMVLPDKRDFDLLRRFISNPGAVLWVKK